MGVPKLGDDTAARTVAGAAKGGVAYPLGAANIGSGCSLAGAANIGSGRVPSSRIRLPNDGIRARPRPGDGAFGIEAPYALGMAALGKFGNSVYFDPPPANAGAAYIGAAAYVGVTANVGATANVGGAAA